MDQQTLELEFRTRRSAVGRVTLTPESDCLIGSGQDASLRLFDDSVVERHARLFWREQGLFVEPLDGALVRVNGDAVTRATPFRHGDWLMLGLISVQLACPQLGADSQSPALEPEAAEPVDEATEIIVGRSPDCGFAIDAPTISRRHARIAIRGGQVWVEDLKSTNGTSINGQRIKKRVALRQGDRVAFGSLLFQFTGEALDPCEEGNRIRVEVTGLTREVKDRKTGQPRRLLDEIDLCIEPGEFVVIFGTSGSGKSTLLDALNGRRPATSGSVAYNGIDLYSAFDLFRSGIGYVPQQDIVHRKIKVSSALGYTARLRLPLDTSRAEIDENIERVLDRVGLLEKADLAVDTPEPLSGGQLKRVSLAVELVANPNILFLDEVTSGLDAGTDKRMMRLFEGLAADGKTVVCVTHSLENIDTCHLVALLHRGCLVYYGPPDQAAAYFGVERLSDVYERLDQQDAKLWESRFRQSSQYRDYVANRKRPVAPGQGPGKPRKRPAPQGGGLYGWFGLRQAATLTRRYIDLLLSDRLNLAVLLLQAPLIALVVGGVFTTEGSLPERAAAESQIAFVLVLSAIWFGCINSAREIVKELPVYLRERSVTVRIPAYLLSKLLPLAVLCVIQCASFLAIVSLMIDFPGSFGERLAVLFLAGFGASAMGLAVSALVNTNDKAIATLPLLLIPQFILSNSVVDLSGFTETFAQVGVIAYWALDAMRATLSTELLDLLGPNGQPVIPVVADWASGLRALAAQAAGFLLVTVFALKLKDRKL
ncbi:MULTISPECIES: FHA domain-containing protein [Thiorhodovibrio]|uniref:FHA domain-containing protein n=1 Tax=Thiorhodovibrio TaxID=61593 RepID=UPI001912389A|nr:FHA domain-containing protein [Thiorhodovibrio litoralis]MBK5969182.1 ABC transporter ATP-binding protein [Thiorhodovibrio winogradskyi]WPL11171.1 ABC transporter ATP-binding/permease protein [Thiorhodovibrio litoralis]